MCVFCSSADAPMTREHVFARWLIRKVHGARFVASGGPSAGAAASTPISKVIAPVCASCNAGWMSSLEVSFRQTLFAAPRVGELQRPARVTVSRWFTKTAVLVAHALGAEFVTPDDRARMRTGMPNAVEVFLSRRRRPRQPLDYAIDLTSDPITGGRLVRAVAVQVDDVFGHIAHQGTLGGAHGTRLWPLRSHTLRWDTLPVITGSPLGL